MDFLNTAWGQLAGLFRSMTPAARLTTGLLLAVIVVSVAYLGSVKFQGGDEYLLNGHRFTSSEMTAAEAAFSKAGLTWSYDGNRIRVPAAQQHVFVAALVDGKALPHDINSPIEAAASESVGPFDSKDQRERVMKIAKQQMLSVVVRSMTGIENAVVSYDTHVRRGLKREELVTASVGVQTVGGQGLEPERVQAIRHFVSSAIAGLSPSDVTVADLRSGKVWAGKGEEGGGSALDDPYLNRKREYEADFSAKIRHALAFVPDVTVSVEVDLDRQLENTLQSTKLDTKGGAAVSTSERSKTRSQEGAGPAGPPGFQANQPNRGDRIAGGARSTTANEEESTSDIRTIYPQQQEFTRKLGLTPDRVTVAIGVPSGYFQEVWQQRNPPKTGEQPKPPDPAALAEIERTEMEKIRGHVQAVLPPAKDAQATPLVTVTRFEQLVSKSLPDPSLAQRAWFWAGQHGSTMALVGLAALALLMLRSMVRAALAAPPPAAATPNSIAMAGTVSGERNEPPTGESADPEPHAPRLRRKTLTGPSLRDELAELVREDPDAAARVLKTWISKAS